jgi:triacylglycerol lipase
MPPLSFEPAQTAFSLVNSLACARAALLAYSERDTVRSTASHWGFADAETFTKGRNEAAVFCNRDVILVAFRGTDRLNDFITNLNILYKRSPIGGFVHRGFMSAVVSFWPDLLQYVRAHRTTDQRVWFTGHSLGGALAVLASIKTHFEDGVPVAGVYTFGQPCIGTVGFCTSFSNRCPYPLYRFVNHTDAVADAPMITLLEHVGEVRYFDIERKLWQGEPPWKLRLRDRIKASRERGGLADFHAHAMKDYVSLIAAQAGLTS